MGHARDSLSVSAIASGGSACANAAGLLIATRSVGRNFDHVPLFIGEHVGSVLVELSGINDGVVGAAVLVAANQGSHDACRSNGSD